MNFQINPTYDLIFLVFITSFITLFFSYRRYFFLSEGAILLIFRLSSLFLLVFLIFNPKFENRGSSKKSLPWHIYIDKSLSIKYHKQPSLISYKSGIKIFLNKIKDKGISFETFSFGSNLDTLNDLNQIDLDANSTNIGLIFNKIENDYQKNVGGIVIFTDGQINQGPPIQEFYKNNRDVPVHIIGIGDTTPMLDVFIKGINSPPLSVKGEKVNIDVVISSIGNINERVNVNLFDEKDKLIGSKLISIFGQENNETIRFQISPTKIGENSFYVKCSAISDEINIQNNHQKITLHVMKDQYNIALVTGAPTYNTKIIKNYLINQGNNSVDHFIMNPKNFNQKLKEFLEKKYEVIIFDNNPVSFNSQKWESVARVFAKKLISHNSSFFIVPGPEIDIKALNKYLKIIDLEINEDNSFSEDEMSWQFTEPWYNLSYVNDNEVFLNEFNSYPPQNQAFTFSDDLDKKQYFASYINGNEKFDNPLLILGEKQQVRYALWNSINLASIKLKLSNSHLEFLFDNSMRKITNWLMKKSDSGQFIFRTDKNSYQHGESVLLTGTSSDLNNNLKFNEGVVELYFDDKYIGSKPLYYDLNEKIYKSRFWAPKPGDIKYVIKVNKGLESYEVNNGTFKVQESHIELNKIFLNEQKLINLSSISNGSFQTWNNKEDVISLIDNVYRDETYISSVTLRYNYFYICLIILLLSLEWFYRKNRGLF